MGTGTLEEISHLEKELDGTANFGDCFLLHRFLGGVTRTLNLSYVKAVPIGKLSYVSTCQIVFMCICVCACVCTCLAHNWSCLPAQNIINPSGSWPIQPLPRPSGLRSLTDGPLPPRNNRDCPCIRVSGGKADGVHQGVDDE